LSTRQIGSIYAAWMSGEEAERALLLSDPLLFLRALAQSMAPDPTPKTPSAILLGDLSALSGIAHRAHRRLRDGAARDLGGSGLDEMRQCFTAAQASAQQLFARCEKELIRARPSDPLSDPSPS
jgi:hypothetical protein